MSDRVFVALPGGTKIGSEYIVPATMTGRQSGNWLHVVFILPVKGNRHVLPQWVHIDNVLFEDEVESVD